MYEGDDDNALYPPDIPSILDADFGSYLILASIAGIFAAVLLFGLSVWALVIGMLMAAPIVFGVALILREDVEDDRTVQQDPVGHRVSSDGHQAHVVQDVAGDQTCTFSPMYPDPMSTSPYDVYNDPSYTYPPIPTGRPEPGRCVECDGKLFLGRENCPHCGTPVSHLDLND